MTLMRSMCRNDCGNHYGVAIKTTENKRKNSTCDTKEKHVFTVTISLTIYSYISKIEVPVLYVKEKTCVCVTACLLYVQHANMNIFLFFILKICLHGNQTSSYRDLDIIIPV